MIRTEYYCLSWLKIVLLTILYKCISLIFQKSFIGAGVKSYDLPFSTKVTDLHTELLRVLNNAKTVSRGISCY